MKGPTIINGCLFGEAVQVDLSRVEAVRVYSNLEQGRLYTLSGNEVSVTEAEARAVIQFKKELAMQAEAEASAILLRKEEIAKESAARATLQFERELAKGTENT